jgi:hypothetical protein
MCFALALASVHARAEGPAPGRIEPVSWELARLRARVARLEARVEKLEDGRVVAADLVGTYGLLDIATYLAGGNPAQVTAQTTAGTVTLAADGTGSVSLKDLGANLIQGSPWFLTPVDRSEAAAFTWTYDTGTLRITPQGGVEAAFQVPAGGRVLTFVSSDSHHAELGILTRLQ